MKVDTCKLSHRQARLRPDRRRPGLARRRAPDGGDATLAVYYVKLAPRHARPRRARRASTRRSARRRLRHPEVPAGLRRRHHGLHRLLEVGRPPRGPPERTCRWLCASRLIAALVAAAGRAPPRRAGRRPTQPTLLAWSKTAARGLFDLCRPTRPTPPWWPSTARSGAGRRFMGYLEHPEGYKREAGGESRRDASRTATKSAYVEAACRAAWSPPPSPAGPLLPLQRGLRPAGQRRSGGLFHRSLRTAGLEDRRRPRSG